MIKLINILKEIITVTEVICDGCGWSWKIADGGDHPYICHKCHTDNSLDIVKDKTSI
jgi:hypothetical protein